MAIGVIFYEGDESVARVVMPRSEFTDEIFPNISEKEYEKWFPDLDDDDEQMVTDKECIIKVWNYCTKQHFISDDLDILFHFIDKMKIIY